MKVVKTVLLIFLYSSALFGKSGLSVTNDPGKKARLMASTLLPGVFFEDFSSGTIFIDFEGLNNPLVSVSILRGTVELFHDPVEDLPLNTIYELNTELMRSGSYTIELVTTEGTKLRRDIRVE